MVARCVNAADVGFQVKSATALGGRGRALGLEMRGAVRSGPVQEPATRRKPTRLAVEQVRSQNTTRAPHCCLELELGPGAKVSTLWRKILRPRGQAARLHAMKVSTGGFDVNK